MKPSLPKDNEHIHLPQSFLPSVLKKKFAFPRTLQKWNHIADTPFGGWFLSLGTTIMRFIYVVVCVVLHSFLLLTTMPLCGCTTTCSNLVSNCCYLFFLSFILRTKKKEIFFKKEVISFYCFYTCRWMTTRVLGLKWANTLEAASGLRSTALGGVISSRLCGEMAASFL